MPSFGILKSSLRQNLSACHQTVNLHGSWFRRGSESMDEQFKDSRYPEGLLDWAGHRAGGVRKLFYAKSGRPSDGVIKTGLLQRLEDWSKLREDSDPCQPGVLLLVGGPGNGKTEAVEFAIHCIDGAISA